MQKFMQLHRFAHCCPGNLCFRFPFAVTDKTVMEQLRRDLVSAPLSGWRGDRFPANSSLRSSTIKQQFLLFT